MCVNESIALCCRAIAHYFVECVKRARMDKRKGLREGKTRSSTQRTFSRNNNSASPPPLVFFLANVFVVGPVSIPPRGGQLLFSPQAIKPTQLESST